MAALPFSLLSPGYSRSCAQERNLIQPTALPLYLVCLPMSTLIYLTLRSSFPANLHLRGPRRTRSSAGAHRYFFRFDPILSPPSNDCSHPPPTDSSRLTNVLSVCSLQYTYIPSPLYLFTRLGAWTTLHCSRYNTSNYFTAVITGEWD